MNDRYKYLLEKQEVAGLDKAELYELQELQDKASEMARDELEDRAWELANNEAESIGDQQFIKDYQAENIDDAMDSAIEVYKAELRS